MRDEVSGDAGSKSTVRHERTTRILLAGILTTALAFRILLVWFARNRPTHDLRIFVSWAQLLSQYGRHGLYQHVDTIDHYVVNYPPLFAIVLGGVDAVYQLLVSHGNGNLVLLGMLLKVPAVVADISLCALVFVVVRRWAGPRPALGAVALTAFAPFTWPISTLWGQVDSICTAFMILALALMFSYRYTLAWSALALAVLVKPLPVVIAPLLLAIQYQEQGLTSRLFAGPACAIGIAYLVALPFAPAIAPLAVLHWLALEYSSGQSLSDATSVNAYNLWTVAWPVLSDSRTVLGLTLHSWGWLAFSAILVPTTVKLFRRLTTEHVRIVREQIMTRACFVVLAALFLMLTRMHERYILFALALAPLMWFCGRWERLTAITLIITFTVCVTLVLGFYEHSWLHEIPAVTRILSLINLAAFTVVMIAFLAAADMPRPVATKQP